MNISGIVDGKRQFIFLLVTAACILVIFGRESMIWKKARGTGAAYYVKNLPDAQAAADHLAYLDETITTFLDRALIKEPKDPRLQRIVERWSKTLSEVPDNADNVAYSLGKNSIYICVREKDGKLANTNTSIFVLLHELAHVATDSYGHTKEFWRNMKYLVELAEEVGVYTYIDHTEGVETLCGRVLGTNPLTCVKNKKCPSEIKKTNSQV